MTGWRIVIRETQKCEASQRMERELLPEKRKNMKRVKNGQETVTQELQNQKTSQEWTRNRYPRTAKSRNKSRP